MKMATIQERIPVLASRGDFIFDPAISAVDPNKNRRSARYGRHFLSVAAGAA